MPRCDKLLQSARNNPAGLRYAELCQLAECYGWEFARQKGSHRMYKRIGSRELMNFQDDGNGGAKPAQVRALLAALREMPVGGE